MVASMTMEKRMKKVSTIMNSIMDTPLEAAPSSQAKGTSGNLYKFISRRLWMDKVPRQALKSIIIPQKVQITIPGHRCSVKK